ncbi:hypothetical protein YTPLAS73_01180 [Nitrosarchaeum sp.]|nr:hypothetical protein YTPLAS73_01180 [Nitrosarchaeum sp.]
MSKKIANFYKLYILTTGMVVCVICKISQGTLKITDGNPKYKGKPICKECHEYRKLLKETK